MHTLVTLGPLEMRRARMHLLMKLVLLVVLIFNNMSHVSNSARPDVEQQPARHKKIAAKTYHLKSPAPYRPDSNGTDRLSSTESFKSAVTAESVGELETEDIMPPARLVVSLSSSKPRPSKAGKKVKSTLKNPHKKKSNPTKQLKGGFWEVESILDSRKKGKHHEYLVQWKGDYENTWEPEKYLNKSALRDAEELLRAKMQQPSEIGLAELPTFNEDVQDLYESGEQFS